MTRAIADNGVFTAHESRPALSLGVAVVSQDDDYVGVPGLELIRV